MGKIETVEELRTLYANPSERARRKQLDHLDRHCRRFVELSPFVLLASSNNTGDTDVSPRGGAPGFAVVEGPRHLLIPDHPGNNRLDTLTNLLQNPGLGLIFLIPGVDETLRVNGLAEIRDDEDLRRRLAVGERLPKLVVRIEVQEAFLHCAKALIRSRLWDPETWIERSALPTMGEMLKDQLALPDPPEGQEHMIERYRANLY